MELPRLNWRSVYADRLLRAERASVVRLSSHGTPTSRSFLAWSLLLSNRSIFYSKFPVEADREPGRASCSIAVLQKQKSTDIEASVDEELQYVPLHVHSDFSLLDGASQLQKLVKRAKELGMQALALTDHGVMYGAVQLVRLCKEAGVTPIVGNEMYIMHVLPPDRAVTMESTVAAAEDSCNPNPPAESPLSSTDSLNHESSSRAEPSTLEPASADTSSGSGTLGEKDFITESGALPLPEIADGTGAPPGPKKRTRKAKKVVESIPMPTVKRFHLTVLAKNAEGYRNLVQLTTASHLHGMQGNGARARPCITRDQLQQHSSGLIVLSGCMASELCRAIMEDRLDDARETVAWYKCVFGCDYYLEVMDHGRPENTRINQFIHQLSQEMDVPLVATNDSHFTLATDHPAHRTLVSVKAGRQLSLVYTGQEFLKSPSELLHSLLHSLPHNAAMEAMRSTVEISGKVQDYGLPSEPRLPSFDVPMGYTDDQWLESQALHGLVDVLELPSVDAISSEYRRRLEVELGVIQQQGFAAYFLIVADIIAFARANDIPVGPGRGSAAGSLVAYALRIISMDPIKHGLLFERFLNEERKSLPDIDSDFCPLGRDRILEYIACKYGSDRVAQIATFSRMGSKAALRDVCRVQGVPLSTVNQLAKLIPVARGKSIGLETLMTAEPPTEFRMKVDADPKLQEVVDMAIRLEGTNRSAGVHAAGVVISPASFPLSECVPLQRAPGKSKPASLSSSSSPSSPSSPLAAASASAVTQYPMDDVERLGLLKFDILGLRNLTTIHTAMRLVRQAYDVALPAMEKLPTNDARTFELLSTGDVDGVFQLEASPGMKRIVRALKPSSLDDLFALVALYRPGPLDAGLVDTYISRKHGREEVSYETPQLEPILKETYGVLLYQEQIMRMARDLAGYSLGQADLLRRAMGKKKRDEMERQRGKFMEGAVERDVSAEVAESLFDQMVKFSEYCFNKSHSAAYGYLTYVTAFLKANYPVAYMAALLSSCMTDPPTLRRYVNSCRRMGLTLLPPCVNESTADFSVKRGLTAGTTTQVDRGASRAVDSAAATAAAGVDGATSLQQQQQQQDHLVANGQYLGGSLHDGSQSSGDEPGFSQSGGIQASGSQSGDAILFGLKGVRGVPRAAIDEIIEKRREGGRFCNVSELCDRVSGSKVTRKALESLAHAGAMDGLVEMRGWVEGQGQEGGGALGVGDAAGGRIHEEGEHALAGSLPIAAAAGSVERQTAVSGTSSAASTSGSVSGSDEAHLEAQGGGQGGEGAVVAAHRFLADRLAIVREIDAWFEADKERKKVAKRKPRVKKAVVAVVAVEAVEGVSGEAGESDASSTGGKKKATRKRKSKKGASAEAEADAVEANVAAAGVMEGDKQADAGMTEQQHAGGANESTTSMSLLGLSPPSASSNRASEGQAFAAATFSSLHPSAAAGAATSTTAQVLDQADNAHCIAQTQVLADAQVSNSSSMEMGMEGGSSPVALADTAADRLQQEQVPPEIQQLQSLILSQDQMAERLRREKELLGFYVTQHPVTAVADQLPDWLVATSLDDCWMEAARNLQEERQEGGEKKAGRKRRGKWKGKAEVRVVGMVDSVTARMVRKSGQEMAVIELDDGTAQREVTVFPGVYGAVRDVIKEGELVLAWCHAELEEKEEEEGEVVDGGVAGIGGISSELGALGSGEQDSDAEGDNDSRRSDAVQGLTGGTRSRGSNRGTSQESASAVGAGTDRRADAGPDASLLYLDALHQRHDVKLTMRAAVRLRDAMVVCVDVTMEEIQNKSFVRMLQQQLTAARHRGRRGGSGGLTAANGSGIEAVGGTENATDEAENEEVSMGPSSIGWRQQGWRVSGMDPDTCVPVVLRIWPSRESMPPQVVADAEFVPGLRAQGLASSVETLQQAPVHARLGDLNNVVDAESTALHLRKCSYRAKTMPLLSYDTRFRKVPMDLAIQNLVLV